MLNAVLSRICVSFGAAAWHNGAEDAEPRRDPHRLVDDRLDDEIGRLLRCESVGTFSYILVGAIIGVRTSGMLIVVKLIPLSRNSDAAQAENESSADFDAT